jgi:hypothetical protein
MSKKPVEEHYDILYQDEQGTRFTVFASTDLNTLGYILADMLRFEEMFHTFPNASCHLRLEKDYNYDPDLGAFRMDALPFGESHKWGILVDDIIHNYGTVLDSPRR